MASWTQTDLYLSRTNQPFDAGIPIDVSLTATDVFHFTIGESLTMNHGLSTDADLRGKRVKFCPALFKGIQLNNPAWITFDIPSGAIAGTQVIGMDCSQASANNILSLLTIATVGATTTFTIKMFFFATMDDLGYHYCGIRQNHDRLLKKREGTLIPELDAANWYTAYDENPLTGHSYGSYSYAIAAVNNLNAFVVPPAALPTTTLEAYGEFYKDNGTAYTLASWLFERSGINVGNTLSTAGDTVVTITADWHGNTPGGAVAYLIRTDTYNNAIPWTANYAMTGGVVKDDGTTALLGVGSPLRGPSQRWTPVSGTTYQIKFVVDGAAMAAYPATSTWRVILVSYVDLSATKPQSIISEELTLSTVPVSVLLPAEAGLFNLIGAGVLRNGLSDVCVYDRLLCQVLPDDADVSDWLAELQTLANRGGRTVNVITTPASITFEVYECLNYDGNTKQIMRRVTHNFDHWEFDAGIGSYVAKFTGMNFPAYQALNGFILNPMSPMFTSSDGITMDGFHHLSHSFRILNEPNTDNVATVIGGVEQWQPTSNQGWAGRWFWCRISVTFNNLWNDAVTQQIVGTYNDTYNWFMKCGTAAKPIYPLDNIAHADNQIESLTLYHADRVTPMNILDICNETLLSCKVTLLPDVVGGTLVAIIERQIWMGHELNEEENFMPTPDPNPQWETVLLINVDVDFVGDPGVAWFDIDLPELIPNASYRVTALRLLSDNPTPVPDCTARIDHLTGVGAGQVRIIQFADDLVADATWELRADPADPDPLEWGTSNIVGLNLYSPTDYFTAADALTDAYVTINLHFADDTSCCLLVHLTRPTVADTWVLVDYVATDCDPGGPVDPPNPCAIAFATAQINQRVAGDPSCSTSFKFTGVPTGITPTGNWFVSDSLYGPTLGSGAWIITVVGGGIRWANTHGIGSYVNPGEHPDIYFWGFLDFGVDCGTLCMYSHLTWDGSHYTLADFGLVNCSLLP